MPKTPNNETLEGTSKDYKCIQKIYDEHLKADEKLMEDLKNLKQKTDQLFLHLETEKLSESNTSSQQSKRKE